MSWSNTLIDQTRKALDEPFFSADGFLHMKNMKGRYGKIHKDHLLQKTWLIKDKHTDDEYLYSTVDELVIAGWAID